MKKIKIINLQDAVFPEKLKLIKSPPKELYAIGNIELLNKPSLAIIGTRQITHYGVKNCEYFAKEIEIMRQKMWKQFALYRQYS